jgi:hypothetical protein
MEEEIKRVIKMLEEGKIKADEAEKLIRAIKEVSESEKFFWKTSCHPYRCRCRFRGHGIKFMDKIEEE